jgi:glycogen operon protein
MMGARFYAYQVDGARAPHHRFDPSKVLFDPYARALHFPLGFDRKAAIGPGANASRAPLGLIAADRERFDWGDDRRPRHEASAVIYELHVRGFTAHPSSGVPAERRGTFAGLVDRIPYLLELGVTVVELMPVFQFDPGEGNYWGYNPISFFAPHNAYAHRCDTCDQHTEFRELVRAFHAAGLEVVLDVVYNHTGEGNQLGPVLSYRGIDNPAYYRLMADRRRYYMDYTGTGNTLNMRHPHVLQLIMDSLRYWVLEMRVDGFRFDLAATLARELHDVDRLSAFFDVIQQDPVVSQVKLIAEPWDIGEGGYQVGNFPPLWSEWNGKYRDTVRDFWRGTDRTLAEFAYRFTGSSDLYAGTARRPYASVNFITAHDGFTLRDVVSYNEKHNEGNGEENRDGENHNRSWNCGEEGPSENPEVLALRARQQRNFLATLMLSQGVPMLLGGDEIGRTQRGNNNAYCQDNEISWFDWVHADEGLLHFTRRLIRLRHRHPVFCRRRWFQGRPIHGSGVSDIGWFTPAGAQMSEEDWNAGFAKSLGVFLNGHAIPTPDERGERILDDSFYVMFNAQHEPVDFRLPPPEWGRRWTKVLDTYESLDELSEERLGREFDAEGVGRVEPWSLVLLRKLA